MGPSNSPGAEIDSISFVFQVKNASASCYKTNSTRLCKYNENAYFASIWSNAKFDFLTVK